MSSQSRLARSLDWDTFPLSRTLPGHSASVTVGRTVSADPPKTDLRRKTSYRKPATVLECLRSLISGPGTREQVEELFDRYPVLKSKRRYSDAGGTWRVIPILGVFLLLRAGFKHWEIARHFNTSRDSVTRMARTLRKAGLSLPCATRPEKAKKKTKPDCTQSIYDIRIEELEREYSCGQITHSELLDGVLDQLDRQWYSFERQWERNGVYCYGMGPSLERFLDRALSYERRIGGGKCVTSHVNKDNGLAEELTHGKPCKALLDYWKNRHLGGWQFDHEQYLRIEHDRRIRQINCTGCPSCRVWLRMPSNRRTYNNPKTARS